MRDRTPPRRRIYRELGSFLREARKKSRDPDTGKVPSVARTAGFLDVTRGFVYQVERGERKPKDGIIGAWASVYGVPLMNLWKCLPQIPMDLVATLRREPQPAPADPFSQLTEDEKTELLPFLDFVRWRISQHTEQQSASDDLRFKGGNHYLGKE